MEQLALDYRKQVDKLFVREKDKGELYDWLHSYNERILPIEDLVSNIRSIISHPHQLILFEYSQCLIRHEDHLKYGMAIPNYSEKRTRSVLLSVSPSERIGLGIRGGLEHQTGFFVVDVEPASAAERCGISIGDELLHVNGHNLKSCTHKEAINLMSRYKSMLAVKIRHVGMIPVPTGPIGKYHWSFCGVIHHEVNGQTSMDSSASSPSLTHAQVHRDINSESNFEGTRTVKLKIENHSTHGFNIVYTREGVFVSIVKPNTPAASAGIVAGDEILKVNGLVMSRATTQEVVTSLKARGDVEMVLRTPHGFRSRSSSSVSINFADPDVGAESEIEAKIDELFESNLAKRVQHVCDKESSTSYFARSRVSEVNVSSSRTPPGIAQNTPPPVPPPPPPPLPSIPITVTAKIRMPRSPAHPETPTESDTSSSYRGLPQADATDGLALNNDLDSSSSGNAASLQDFPEHGNMIPGELKNNEGDELLLAVSSGGYFEDARLTANRRQKLEAELRERLKLERQKRLVQEKSLRLDRLRQELKETEREEARLQKWLADSANVEDIHHIVGGYTNEDPGRVLSKVFPAEFDLTTPTDMRQRNTRTIVPRSPNNDTSRILLHNRDGRKIIVSETSEGTTSEIRFEKEIDGRKIVISEIRKSLMNQAAGGRVTSVNEPPSATIDEGERVRRARKATLTVVTSPDYARVNPINEITFF